MLFLQVLSKLGGGKKKGVTFTWPDWILKRGRGFWTRFAWTFTEFSPNVLIDKQPIFKTEQNILPWRDDERIYDSLNFMQISRGVTIPSGHDSTRMFSVWIKQIPIPRGIVLLHLTQRTSESYFKWNDRILLKINVIYIVVLAISHLLPFFFFFFSIQALSKHR